MGGFFGTVAKATSCVADLFYGTDYNSHLGTKRGGLATYDAETEQFTRSIHNLESTYFRTKFEWRHTLRLSCQSQSEYVPSGRERQ